MSAETRVKLINHLAEQVIQFYLEGGATGSTLLDAGEEDRIKFLNHFFDVENISEDRINKDIKYLHDLRRRVVWDGEESV